MMRKVTKMAMAVVISASCIGIGTVVANGAGLLSAQPGDSGDPLVTKSYVDKLFASISGNSNSGQTGEGSTGSAASTEMEIVTLTSGQQLIAKGGTEIVVRSGKSVIYSADENGVSDVTDGVDLLNGVETPKNHLLMFPRDGRGITAMNQDKNSVTVMVRGEYTIKNIEAIQ